MEMGIQVSSLKPLLVTAEQVRQAFAGIASLGCRYVQLQWIDPEVPIGDIADALEQAGLSSVGVQDFYERVAEDLLYYVNLNRATGGVWVAVSRIPHRCKSRAGLKDFVLELKQLQETLAPLGQKLCFHPVTGDYLAVPEFDAVEYLMDALPDMALCLDLYHLHRCCGDMPGFIRRYSGRIPMVHFKDADERGKLVPAGQGIVAWDGLMAACREAGVTWGLGEQEQWEGDPYQCLAQALRWMENRWNAEQEFPG